jgi:hypothetical protein
LRIADFPTHQQTRKSRIALAPAFAHNLSMLARVLSAAVNGIEASRMRR